MSQSSITSWLKKPTPPQQQEQPSETTSAPPTLTRPPPPPKSASSSHAPSTTTPAPQSMDNWNDIPEDFLQAPSRPRSKKSPRSSKAVTPIPSRVPTPVTVPVQKPSLQLLFALRPLPPNVELAPLTQDLLPSFKRLNDVTLPVAYPDSFYKETMTEPHNSLTLVALWHPAPLQPSTNGDTPIDPPQLVGAIRCRIFPASCLYICTFGILAPYRSHGIAMHLLHAVTRKALKLHGVRSISAHVWEANEEGLEWYKKRKFDVLGMEEDYYRKLRPAGAHVVAKRIGVVDLLGGASAEGWTADGSVG